MKTSTILLGLCGAAALFTGSSAFAQASLSAAGYTQNFSSMGATGTTAPTGWSVVSEAGSHYTFSPNVANEYTDGNAAQNENFTAGALTTESTLSTSASYDGAEGINFSNTLATTQNGEGSQSLGSNPSGTAGTILELSLTNNTGSAISSINLSYDIDRFTAITNTRDIPSGYANTGVEEFPGYHLFYNLTPSNNATWVDVTALDPTVNMGTVAGAVNVPDTVGITVVPTTTVSLGGSVANGSTFALAWFDDNAISPSPDQAIGLNNVVVSAAAVPEPSSIALGLVAMSLAAVMIRRRSVA